MSWSVSLAQVKGTEVLDQLDAGFQDANASADVEADYKLARTTVKNFLGKNPSEDDYWYVSVFGHKPVDADDTAQQSFAVSISKSMTAPEPAAEGGNAEGDNVQAVEAESTDADGDA